MILPTRRTAVLVGENAWLEAQVQRLFSSMEADESAVILDVENFSKAKNLLGQEFGRILYDARQALNLDALVIASGTLKAGGMLLMLFNRWDDLTEWRDGDSLRWSGEYSDIDGQSIKQPIFTPHFLAFFQRKIVEHRIPIYRQDCHDTLPLTPLLSAQTAAVKLAQCMPTLQQTQIINRILQRQAGIYLVTAKRGRGKSALAGFLSRSLTPRERVILTAPNKSAVKILLDFAGDEAVFIAPDELCRQIRENPLKFQQDWLFIDEAAMIPLALLDCLTSTFKHILCTTTIHSYEGTGRGFLLKFVAKIDRTFCQFELSEPLRWAENDPLERFTDDLLLLDCEDHLRQLYYQPELPIKIQSLTQRELIQREAFIDFYALLTLAHYRTSPLDLRRLFDAPQQRFWTAATRQHLLGCLWAMEEGGLNDEGLIADISRGIRRPSGNLAVQALAFQSNLTQACRLKSLRISRIAVLPNWQRHGIGRQLIEQIASEEIDFLSVSFGYTPQLLHFWQKCGFFLVQIGEHKEAASGCYSALALRPISAAGKALADNARLHFERNIGLSFHPLATHFSIEPAWDLTEEDWQILQNFADFNRTLSSSLGAIRRLLNVVGLQDCPLLSQYCLHCQADKVIAGGKKPWLKQCREEVKKLLQKHGRVFNMPKNSSWGSYARTNEKTKLV